ncbi:MAG: DNA-directed RNA polymerase subunit beta [Candidatus Ornithospirochaeta sp.]|nr:DNA-directed RNA polymerase subunit beta [Sphaerochaetaceae bacterium]MDY5524524.1 DNA-directed RNA polymerase subunit beta [Candidatus Ornithospirochaeta sp.]
MAGNGKEYERVNIGSEVLNEYPVPNLVEIQTSSYKDFLQLDKIMKGQQPDEELGLEHLFNTYFPIESPNGDMRIEYAGYSVDPDDIYAMKSETECKRKGATFGVPVKVKVRLVKRNSDIQERDIFFGEFPVMTDRGTFIINGSERVIVSSIVRSPGVIFKNMNKKGQKSSLFTANLYPYLGSMLSFVFERTNVDDKENKLDAKEDYVEDFDGESGEAGDKESKYIIYAAAHNIIYATSPRSKDDTQSFKKIAIPVTFFMRMLGLDTRDKIVAQFYSSELIDTGDYDGHFPRFLYKDIKRDNETLFCAGDAVDKNTLQSLYATGVTEVEVVDTLETNLDDLPAMAILKTLQQERSLIYRAKHISTMNKRAISVKRSEWDDIERIYREEGKEFRDLYLGYIAEKWKTFLPQHIRTTNDNDRVLKYYQEFFRDKNRYDFSRIGRYKLNKKFFGMDEEKYISETTLTIEDVIQTSRMIMDFGDGKFGKDDEDSLGNRRVRTVRELLENSLADAFSKMVKAAKDKMNLSEDDVKAQDIISIKPIIGTVREFFGSSQLSQFMDQVNPLAELTHKRRISAIGPKGGIKRDNARQLFDVRDVNYTHYGKICPIETPEGGNIGLILTLANYAKINEFGFIETPYRKVLDGVVLMDDEETKYLDVNDEEKSTIAQGNAYVEKSGKDFVLKGDVSVRANQDYSTVSPDKVNWMDVSPKQVVSVAASLIPFLEHDDANRALMGSNMQRQAVPLVFPETPRVGTGMEKRTAYDSSIMVKSRRAGEVVYVSSVAIKVKPDAPSVPGELDVYELRKYEITNQDSCMNQRPLVNVGDRVEKGSVLADGPSTDHGELALGRNILVGFVPWNGYNYEDAVLISERVVSEDIYTSIHIKEFETDRKETKLGEERFSRDLPNTSDRAVEHLDSDGIVCIGTYVRSGDILVGKTTPKTETENTPEQKLLNSIFGEKSKDTRNASLVVPHGVEGTVIDIQRITKKEELAAGSLETVKVYIATKRKLKQGDKMAGRHGNKGVVSRVLPQEDMPYMEDGTPLDVCLNPLGVPSRMNIGQLMETQLGWAAVKNDVWYKTPVFQSATMEQIEEEMVKAGLPKDSKVTLYDGRTGVPFVNKVFCGYIYYLKLHHLVDDKMHARATGPYSLVTQQPLGGKAMFGGQRLGEMEVWAFEAYGAANNLQELLTVKSDDMQGRVNIYQSIVKGEPAKQADDLPEGYKVLCQGLRGLALDLAAYDKDGNLIPLTERDREIIKKKEKDNQ